MSNLLNRARADITIAKMLLTPVGNPTNDEMITDQAAYHVQQAIEKALKYMTEELGLPYRKIHNLIGLIAPLEEEGFEVPETLKNMAYIISGWEASTRYEDDSSVVREEIENAIELYAELESVVLERVKKT